MKSIMRTGGGNRISYVNIDPPIQDETIWRYMDLAKFISLLDTSKIFFPRADKLGDKFEGAFSKANVRRWETQAKSIENVLANYRAIYESEQKSTFISCWHINKHESDAMWKAFSPGTQGIAIQSRMFNFEQSISGYEENNIVIGKVNYIDYEEDKVPEGFLLVPFLYKRKCYEHENELRAIIQINPRLNDKNPNGQEIKGLLVNVNLNTLIDKIFISSTAPDWFDKVVTSVVKKFDLKKNIFNSSINDEPIYIGEGNMT